MRFFWFAIMLLVACAAAVPLGGLVGVDKLVNGDVLEKGILNNADLSVGDPFNSVNPQQLAGKANKLKDLGADEDIPSGDC